MSCVWHGSVHTQFVALHLVELISGVRILAWSDDCGSNIQVLVKILPAYLTYKHTHKTHTIKKNRGMHNDQICGLTEVLR